MHNFVKGIFISACYFACNAQAETLGDIYQQALENDHQYRAAIADYEAGKESKALGRAALLPSIGGQYVWTDSETDRTGSGPFYDLSGNVVLDENDEAVISDSITTTTAIDSGYSISLSQPLFDLAAWHTYRRGTLESKIALAEYQTEKQLLIVRTAEAYFEVLRVIDDFQTAKAEENATESQLEQTRKRFEVGLTAITEVHEAQAAYDNSRARRLLAEGRVGIAFEALEVITGQPYFALSPLKDNFTILPPTPIERDAWEAFAAANNFALAAASLRAQAAKQQAKAARAEHAPTVTASVNYFENTSESENTTVVVVDPSLRTVRPGDFDNEGLSTSITVSVPLFAGGAISATRRQAQQQYYAAQERYNLSQRDIKQQARSLHLSVLTDVATVKARQQAITSSQSALDATQAGYEVGTRDLVDVLNAQRILFTAQSEYSDALYTYVLNTLRLKAVAGTLNAKDIAELDTWLDRSKQVTRITP